MRIIAKSRLKKFWEKHADAEQAMKSWYAIVEKVDWASPQDVKDRFARASILRDNRVVFDIAGGNYRLVVKFNYPYRIAYIRFVGTHKQYDSIDSEDV